MDKDFLRCRRHAPRQQLRHVLSLVSVLNATLSTRPVSPFLAPKEAFSKSVLVPGPALQNQN